MRKSKGTKLILEILKGGTKLTEDICEPFFCSYYTSYKKARTSLLKSADKAREEAQKFKERQNFYSLMNYLKREGLVLRRKEGVTSYWSLTSKGKKKRVALKNERDIEFKKVPSQSILIFSYDIPEKMRRERDWIRGVLKFLDFQMVHQSVWLGTNLIPEDFFRKIKEKQLDTCVHIFEVGKRGTLKQIV